MPRVRVLSSLLTLLLFSAVPANEIAPGPWQDESRVPLKVPRLSGPVKTDGVLSEALWSKALLIDLPVEVRPGDNLAARVRTEALLAYDQDQLYIAFRCFDPEPELVRAHYLDRDKIWDDEWAGVVLDTFNDERRSFLFLVNPLGVQADLIETSRGNDMGWDGIWGSGGQVHEWGWAVEIVIPVTSLRFQHQEGPQVWGFDAVRSHPRDTRRQYGSFPRDRANNCYLCQTLKIELFDDVEPGKNLEIAPTLTGNYQQERSPFPDGSFETQDESGELGVTARWGMTPNLTLSGAVNPDFSDIEADALQLDVNRPFALFVEEKRPFFTEGSDFFRSRQRVVHTRTVRDPRWGGKLSGKYGSNSIGSFVVRDAVTNIVLPGPRGSAGLQLQDSDGADVESTDGVLRYEREISNRHTIGMIATSRSAGNYSNRVFGADAKFRVTDQDQINVQLLRSRTEDVADVRAIAHPAEQVIADTAFEISYSHRNKSSTAWAEYRDFGAGFRADLGFIPRVNIRQAEAGYDRLWFGNDKTWYSLLNLGTVVEVVEDHSGNPMASSATIWSGFRGPLQAHGSFVVSRFHNTFVPPAGSLSDRKTFDYTRVRTAFEFWPSGNLYLGIRATLGQDIFYSGVTYPEVDPFTVFLGRLVRISPSLRYNLGLHLKVTLSHTHERNRVRDDLGYRAGITELRTIYQFSLRSFIRAVLQYTDVEDFSGFEFQQLSSELLYSYRVNPQVVLFAGYADGRQGSQEIELTQRNRRYFVKLGYAWVL